MNCYGTYQYGKLKDCEKCELATYCQTAKAPPSYAVEYNDKISELLEENSFAFFDDPIKEEPPTQEKIHLNKLSYSLKHLIHLIIKITQADPIRSFIILGRIGGLTQTQIGITCGMTKQAISKHCQSIFSENKELEQFLKAPLIPDESIQSIFKKKRYNTRRNDGRRKNITNTEQTTYN